MTTKTATEFKFNVCGDYKKQFADYVKELNNIALELSVEERKTYIEALTDAYIRVTGERPDGKELEKLGTLLLLEYYTSTQKNKKDEDNPVLSTKQVLRRKLNERRYVDEVDHE